MILNVNAAGLVRFPEMERGVRGESTLVLHFRLCFAQTVLRFCTLKTNWGKPYTIFWRLLKFQNSNWCSKAGTCRKLQFLHCHQQSNIFQSQKKFFLIFPSSMNNGTGSYSYRSLSNILTQIPFDANPKLRKLSVVALDLCHPQH